MGKGEIKAKLELRSCRRFQPAVEAVKKAGGNVTTTFKKPVYMNKKGEPGKRVQRRKKAAEKRAGQSNA